MGMPAGTWSVRPTLINWPCTNFDPLWRSLYLDYLATDLALRLGLVTTETGPCTVV